MSQDGDTGEEEWRNATELFEPFPVAASLRDLEEFIAAARGRGARDDARPRVKVGSGGGIAGIVCAVPSRTTQPRGQR